MNSSLWFVFQLQSSEQTLKHSHINSTNLSFLEAVLLTVENETNVTAVFKPFCSLGHNSTESNCIVDIVANHGLCWIKVTARKSSALHRIWQGTQSIHIPIQTELYKRLFISWIMEASLLPWAAYTVFGRFCVFHYCNNNLNQTDSLRG